MEPQKLFRILWCIIIISTVNAVQLEEQDLWGSGAGFPGGSSQLSQALAYYGQGESSQMSSDKRRCGGVIRCLNQDTDKEGSTNNIHHKHIGPIRLQERCVWILVAEGATKYILKASSLAYPREGSNPFGKMDRTPKGGVLVTGVSFDHDLLPTLSMTSVNSSITLHAAIVIVTIWSRDSAQKNIGSEVLLNYHVIPETNPLYAPISRQSFHRLIHPGYIISHPSKLENSKVTSVSTQGILNRELSSFTFMR